MADSGAAAGLDSRNHRSLCASRCLETRPAVKDRLVETSLFQHFQERPLPDRSRYSPVPRALADQLLGSNMRLE